MAATLLALGAAAVQAQEPLDAAGAWVLQLDTRGGITGRGRGSYRLTSAGDLTCTRGDECRRRLSRDSVVFFARTIAAVPVDAWVEQPRSTCSDCFEMILRLRRREGNELRTYVAAWDDSQSIPPPLRTLAETLFALGRAPVR